MSEHIFYKGIRRVLAATAAGSITTMAVVMGTAESTSDAHAPRLPHTEVRPLNYEVIREVPSSPADPGSLPAQAIILGGIMTLMEYGAARHKLALRQQQWEDMGVDGHFDELSYFDEGHKQAFDEIERHWNDQ